MDQQHGEGLERRRGPVTTTVTVERSAGPALRLAIGGSQAAASWVDPDGSATPPVSVQVNQEFVWYLHGVRRHAGQHAPRHDAASGAGGTGASPAASPSPSSSPSARRSPRSYRVAASAAAGAGSDCTPRRVDPACPPWPLRSRSRSAPTGHRDHGLEGDHAEGFKQFILRGNVVDLAVAVVIGAAFGAVVTAFVADIITPLIAAIFGKPDFSTLTFTINHSTFLYGSFINAVVAFVLIAAAVYFAVVVPDERDRRTSRPWPGPDHEGVPAVPERDQHRRAALPALHL